MSYRAHSSGGAAGSTSHSRTTSAQRRAGPPSSSAAAAASAAVATSTTDRVFLQVIGLPPTAKGAPFKFKLGLRSTFQSLFRSLPIDTNRPRGSPANLPAILSWGGLTLTEGMCPEVAGMRAGEHHAAIIEVCYPSPDGTYAIKIGDHPHFNNNSISGNNSQQQYQQQQQRGRSSVGGAAIFDHPTVAFPVVAHPNGGGASPIVANPLRTSSSISITNGPAGAGRQQQQQQQYGGASPAAGYDPSIDPSRRGGIAAAAIHQTRLQVRSPSRDDTGRGGAQHQQRYAAPSVSVASSSVPRGPRDGSRHRSPSARMVDTITSAFGGQGGAADPMGGSGTSTRTGVADRRPAAVASASRGGGGGGYAQQQQQQQQTERQHSRPHVVLSAPVAPSNAAAPADGGGLVETPRRRAGLTAPSVSQQQQYNYHHHTTAAAADGSSPLPRGADASLLRPRAEAPPAAAVVVGPYADEGVRVTTPSRRTNGDRFVSPRLSDARHRGAETGQEEKQGTTPRRQQPQHPQQLQYRPDIASPSLVSVSPATPQSHHHHVSATGYFGSPRVPAQYATAAAVAEESSAAADAYRQQQSQSQHHHRSSPQRLLPPPAAASTSSLSPRGAEAAEARRARSIATVLNGGNSVLLAIAGGGDDAAPAAEYADGYAAISDTTTMQLEAGTPRRIGGGRGGGDDCYTEETPQKLPSLLDGYSNGSGRLASPRQGYVAPIPFNQDVIDAEAERERAIMRLGTTTSSAAVAVAPSLKAASSPQRVQSRTNSAQSQRGQQQQEQPSEEGGLYGMNVTPAASAFPQQQQRSRSAQHRFEPLGEGLVGQQRSGGAGAGEVSRASTFASSSVLVHDNTAVMRIFGANGNTSTNTSSGNYNNATHTNPNASIVYDSRSVSGVAEAGEASTSSSAPTAGFGSTAVYAPHQQQRAASPVADYATARLREQSEALKVAQREQSEKDAIIGELMETLRRQQAAMEALVAGQQQQQQQQQQSSYRPPSSFAEGSYTPVIGGGVDAIVPNTRAPSFSTGHPRTGGAAHATLSSGSVDDRFAYSNANAAAAASAAAAAASTPLSSPQRRTALMPPSLNSAATTPDASRLPSATPPPPQPQPQPQPQAGAIAAVTPPAAASAELFFSSAPVAPPTAEVGRANGIIDTPSQQQSFQQQQHRSDSGIPSEQHQQHQQHHQATSPSAPTAPAAPQSPFFVTPLPPHRNGLFVEQFMGSREAGPSAVISSPSARKAMEEANRDRLEAIAESEAKTAEAAAAARTEAAAPAVAVAPAVGSEVASAAAAPSLTEEALLLQSIAAQQQRLAALRSRGAIPTTTPPFQQQQQHASAAYGVVDSRAGSLEQRMGDRERERDIQQRPPPEVIVGPSAAAREAFMRRTASMEKQQQQLQQLQLQQQNQTAAPNQRRLIATPAPDDTNGGAPVGMGEATAVVDVAGYHRSVSMLTSSSVNVNVNNPIANDTNGGLPIGAVYPSATAAAAAHDIHQHHQYQQQHHYSTAASSAAGTAVTTATAKAAVASKLREANSSIEALRLELLAREGQMAELSAKNERLTRQNVGGIEKLEALRRANAELSARLEERQQVRGTLPASAAAAVGDVVDYTPQSSAPLNNNNASNLLPHRSASSSAAHHQRRSASAASANNNNHYDPTSAALSANRSASIVDAFVSSAAAPVPAYQQQQQQLRHVPHHTPDIHDQHQQHLQYPHQYDVVAGGGFGFGGGALQSQAAPPLQVPCSAAAASVSSGYGHGGGAAPAALDGSVSGCGGGGLSASAYNGDRVSSLRNSYSSAPSPLTLFKSQRM